MNWSRGLFRAWALTSALWAAFWVLLNWAAVAHGLSDLSCLIGSRSGPWCDYRNIGAITVGGLEDRAFWVVLVSPPFAVGLLGYALLWVARGFRKAL